MIDQCLEIVDDESKIVADVLICNSQSAISEESDVGTSISNYIRGHELYKNVHASDSLDYMMLSHPDVQYRYVVYQSDPASIGAIDFNPRVTWQLQLNGRADAQAILENPGIY